MPTDQQLANRLNPTPATIYTPNNGISTDTNQEYLYISGADGTTRGMHITNVLSQAEIDAANKQAGNASGAIQAARDRLSSQYGIDFNSLAKVNKADLDQQLIRSGHVIASNGVADYGNPSVSDFFQQKAATLTPTTINGTAPTETIVPQGAPPVGGQSSTDPSRVINSTTGQTAGQMNQPTTTTPVDTNYQMKPGETPEQYNARIANYNTVKNTPPSTIGNPVTPPTTTGAAPALNLPTPTAASTAATYVTGLTATLESQKAALQAESDKRAQEYQTQIDQLNADQKALQAKEDAAATGLKTQTDQQTAEKKAALDEEKKRFDENYAANQALVGELDGLLTTGNQIVEQMKGTTGLASIMEPRIAKTMTDVAARAAVIQAVMSARNGQIGQAQNQLSSSLSAISSIYGDQIDYYKSIMSYYDGLKDEKGAKIASLTSQQKDYLDTKLSLLTSDLKQTQDTAALISKAMVDPDTALAYAKAGVSLSDSPQAINQKLAQYAYSQEVSNISNTMAEKGYSTTPIAGVSPVTITDSNGVARNYYKAASSDSGDFTLGTNQIRFDAAGNVVAVGPAGAGTGTSVSERTAATEGNDLADAKAFLAQNPGKTTEARQTFLQAHPSAGAAWDNYFKDGYPEAPAAPKNGLFGLGFFGL